MDDGVGYLNIVEDDDCQERLRSDFTFLHDIDLYYKASCIYSVRFFPRGMGEDSMVSDEEYLVDRHQPLDAPPGPLDRAQPAFELCRYIPAHSALRSIVRGGRLGAAPPRPKPRPARRVVARGEKMRAPLEHLWRVSWASPAPVQEMNPHHMAKLLLQSALDIAAQYEVLANARKVK